MSRLIGMLILLCLLPSLASAETATLDQVYDPTPLNSGSNILRGRYVAQTFTVGITGVLVSVDLIVRRKGTVVVEPLLVDVRETIGGVPVEADSPILASATVPASEVTTSPAFVTVDLSASNLFVEKGEMLALVLTTNSKTSDTQLNEYTWTGSTVELYEGGDYYGRSEGFTWTTLAGRDLGFRTTVCPFGLVERDQVYGSGDGLLTFDMATGLEWLDWSQTTYRSYNDVSSKLGSGQEFEGFRYATELEVMELYRESAGIPFVPDDNNPDNVPAASALTELLGVTFGAPAPSNGGAEAIYARVDKPGEHWVTAVLHGVGTVDLRWLEAGANSTYSFVGHALVRERPLEERDLACGSGDGFITYDAISGLEWLDWSYTTDRSYNDIASRFGSGQEFEGFRHATKGELLRLFNRSAGFPVVPSGNEPANVPAAEVFTWLFGKTFGNPAPAHGGTEGVYGQPNAQGKHWVASAAHFTGLVTPYTFEALDQNAQSYYGHALVRQLPEPSTGLLQATALATLLVLLGSRRRWAGD